MDFFWVVVWAVVFSTLCYGMAERKGRDPWGWAAIGAIGGLVAFFVLWLLKPVHHGSLYRHDTARLRSWPETADALHALARSDRQGLGFSAMADEAGLEESELEDVLEWLVDRDAVEPAGDGWLLTPRGQILEGLAPED